MKSKNEAKAKAKAKEKAEDAERTDSIQRYLGFKSPEGAECRKGVQPLEFAKDEKGVK